MIVATKGTELMKVDQVWVAIAMRDGTRAKANSWHEVFLMTGKLKAVCLPSCLWQSGGGRSVKPHGVSLKSFSQSSYQAPRIR